MISFLIKYKKYILIITLAFFIGSIAYIGLDSYRRSSHSTKVASVGNTDITYRAFYKAVQEQERALRDRGLDIEENMSQLIEQEVLRSLITNEVMNQAAQSFGIDVADADIAQDIASIPAFNQTGHFDKTAYEAFVKHQLGMTPAEFENQIRSIKMQQRFQQALFSLYKLTPEEVRFAYLTQNGNMKDFDKNKKDFERQLFETKMETAQKAFFDDFNNRVEIKTFTNSQD